MNKLDLKKGIIVKVSQTALDPYYRGFKGKVTQIKGDKVVLNNRMIFDIAEVELA